jgi:hypothetical protein
MVRRPYTKEGRLADVLALIQVLALNSHTKRTEPGIAKDLLGPPTSSTSWYQVAKDHREFFRVNPDDELGLSLVARYALPHNDSGGRPQLSPDFVSTLLETAITLHDRQVSAAETWKSFVPLWASLGAGLLGALGVLAGAWMGHHA